MVHVSFLNYIAEGLKSFKRNPVAGLLLTIGTAGMIAFNNILSNAQSLETDLRYIYASAKTLKVDSTAYSILDLLSGHALWLFVHMVISAIAIVLWTRAAWPGLQNRADFRPALLLPAMLRAFGHFITATVYAAMVAAVLILLIFLSAKLQAILGLFLMVFAVLAIAVIAIDLTIVAIFASAHEATYTPISFLTARRQTRPFMDSLVGVFLLLLVLTAIGNHYLLTKLAVGVDGSVGFEVYFLLGLPSAVVTLILAGGMALIHTAVDQRKKLSEMLAENTLNPEAAKS